MRCMLKRKKKQARINVMQEIKTPGSWKRSGCDADAALRHALLISLAFAAGDTPSSA